MHASLESGDPGFVLVDSRGKDAWEQGRVPGAVHLPTADIPARASDLLDAAVPVITYSWESGCDGATRAALALARLGYHVKEMIGGISTGPVRGSRSRARTVWCGARPTR